MKRIFLLGGFFLLILASLLWQVSRSTTYQVFGEIYACMPNSQKTVALTFDDGPTQATDQILQILADAGIKGTFFLTGQELEKNPEAGKKIATAGHEIGNHSYSHSRMVLVSQAFVKEEIEKTDRLIRATGYNGIIHFRPPYGKKLFALPWYLAENRRRTITWDVAPDADSSPTNTAEKIAANTLAQVKPGSIILLHVMYLGRTESMKAVKLIAAGLKSQGYEMKTVSDLFPLPRKSD